MDNFFKVNIKFYKSVSFEIQVSKVLKMFDGSLSIKISICLTKSLISFFVWD